MGIWNNSFDLRKVIKLSTYRNVEQHYSIHYPENWKIETNKEGVVSIESDKMTGGIYISSHNGITFPDEHMVDFILKSNHISIDYKQKVRSGEENGIKSWYISYTDPTNHLICMSVYKRRGDKLWFVSTETDPNLWKIGWKELIIDIVSSFQIEAPY